jgi:transposase
MVAGKFACMVGASQDAERPSYAELEAQIAGRDARIAELESQIAELRAVVAELRARLGQSSRNSSKPPSSDGYRKAPVKKNRSLRKRSGRKPGGQQGHGGAHLERVALPDARVLHEPAGCGGCGGDLSDSERLQEGEESRQVFDLPEEIALRVIEHVAVNRLCMGCGQISTGLFPRGVAAPVQYGPALRALGVYLHVFQHLPYDRARQLIFDMTGSDVSTGTLKAWVDQAAAGLTEFDEQLRQLLKNAPVVHFDETGGRIAGRLGWIHSASTEQLTRYTSHEKRGVIAMDAAGVLPGFRGVAVHDGWKPYTTYQEAVHALCAGHHLRELLAAQEMGQAWASGMSCLLLDAKDMVDRAKTAGVSTLTAVALAQLHACYREVIGAGYEENPGLAESTGQKVKRTKAQNLLLRLDSQEAEALRFAHDSQVPFTNNLAESDIRMVKLQQKISGCWRTDDGAERYLRVRSYISTARKQGQRPLDVLAQLAAGRAWLPAPAPG